MSYMDHAVIAESRIQEVSLDEIDLVDGAKLSESAALFGACALAIPVVGETAGLFLAGVALGAYLSGN